MNRAKLLTIGILLANVIPVYGITAWDWSVVNVVAVAWFEAAVFGLLSSMRLFVMEQEEGADPVITPALSQATFVFTLMMLGTGWATVHFLGDGSTRPDLARIFLNPQVLIAMACVAAGEMLAFYWRFVRSEEYETTPQDAAIFEWLLRPAGVAAIVAAGFFLMPRFGRTGLTMASLLAVKIFFRCLEEAPLSYKDSISE
jgi:hypothetical protein